MAILFAGINSNADINSSKKVCNPVQVSGQGHFKQSAKAGRAHNSLCETTDREIKEGREVRIHGSVCRVEYHVTRKILNAILEFIIIIKRV